MSKLMQRLGDPSRSGVYRVSRADAIADATRGSALDVVRIDASHDPLQAMARALGFPDWFGGNWDALEDSLADLSWREAPGYVLLVDGLAPGDRTGILIDVLRSAAEQWSARGKPFFAVLIDARKQLALPDLYRET